jgi:serine/threonine protein kinase
MFLPKSKIEWFCQICLAVKHIHDRKTIHRDLKSQNIFLTAKNEIKLGDFGIAKVLSQTREVAKTMVGTPYYISPEIINSRPYSFATDIWSIGVILYEMCAGQAPFQAKTLNMLALKIVKGSYEPIPQKYSYELSQLLANLLIVDPQKRPSINKVLEMPILKNIVQRHMTKDAYNSEFSHTVLHNQQIHNVNKSNLMANFDNLKMYDIENPRETYINLMHAQSKETVSSNDNRLPLVHNNAISSAVRNPANGSERHPPDSRNGNGNGKNGNVGYNLPNRNRVNGLQVEIDNKAKKINDGPGSAVTNHKQPRNDLFYGNPSNKPPISSNNSNLIRYNNVATPKLKPSQIKSPNPKVGDAGYYGDLHIGGSGGCFARQLSPGIRAGCGQSPYLAGGKKPNRPQSGQAIGTPSKIAHNKYGGTPKAGKPKSQQVIVSKRAEESKLLRVQNEAKIKENKEKQIQEARDRRQKVLSSKGAKRQANYASSPSGNLHKNADLQKANELERFKQRNSNSRQKSRSNQQNSSIFESQDLQVFDNEVKPPINKSAQSIPDGHPPARGSRQGGRRNSKRDIPAGANNSNHSIHPSVSSYSEMTDLSVIGIKASMEGSK